MHAVITIALSNLLIIVIFNVGLILLHFESIFKEEKVYMIFW